MGFGLNGIGRNGYWPNWELDQVALDEMALDEMGLDEVAIPRGGYIFENSNFSDNNDFHGKNDAQVKTNICGMHRARSMIIGNNDLPQ